MSQVYNLEPPTKGKVVLHTTHGDIEIELWPKEAPKATRNFAQLCMEGYYDGTRFHRIIKDFMIQGGDPTGTGQGGESIYGRPFRNEFHSRLKFTHRGLVACANVAGEAESNGSQFFITLDRCDHLTRQNTIFGRVSGDTIFTVARMAEVEVDDDDRPVDAPIVVSSDVLWPPFDDIVPRTTPAQRAAAAAERAEQQKRADIQQRKQTGKKLNVLSFGDEAEEDDEAAAGFAADVRFRSAHETLAGDAKLRQEQAGIHDAHVVALQERLAREKAEALAQQSEADQKVAPPEGEVDEAAAFAAQLREQARSKGKAHRNEAADEPSTSAAAAGPDAAEASAPSREKIEKLKLSKEGKGAAATRKRDGEVADSELLTQYQQALAKFKKRKLTKGEREAETLSKFRKFKERMKEDASAARGPDGVAPGTADKTADEASEKDGTGEAYDGQVDDESEDEHIDLATLTSHRMVWNPDDGVGNAMKRRDDVDDYKVVDPLLEAGRAAFDKKQQHKKKRQNEWAGKANM